jgi:hypothetical protein
MQPRRVQARYRLERAAVQSQQRNLGRCHSDNTNDNRTWNEFFGEDGNGCIVNNWIRSSAGYGGLASDRFGECEWNEGCFVFAGEWLWGNWEIGRCLMQWQYMHSILED